MEEGRVLFILTGGFTKAEMKEVGPDRVSPIDLINGDQLVDQHTELSLEGNTGAGRAVTISADWFIYIDIIASCRLSNQKLKPNPLNPPP